MQENEHISTENSKEKKPKLKFSDYVYYYKWHAIIIIVALLTVTLATCQLIKNEKVDIYITYAGSHYYNPTDLNEARNAFVSVMSKDFNGDGKKSVEILNLTYLTEKEWEEARSRAQAESEALLYPINGDSLQRLSNELLSGESYIFFLSYDLYKKNYDLGRFAELESVLGYKPDNMIDECAIYLKDTDFGKYFDYINVLPENTVICFKKLPQISFLNKEKDIEKYNNNVQMLKDILNFELPF